MTSPAPCWPFAVAAGSPTKTRVQRLPDLRQRRHRRAERTGRGVARERGLRGGASRERRLVDVRVLWRRADHQVEPRCLKAADRQRAPELRLAARGREREQAG